MTQVKRLMELDALRGIAALAVVLFHLTVGRREGLYVFNLGSTGVELFFMISGFVILMTVEKADSPKEFMISRFTRLYPTYWACVILTTLLMGGVAFGKFAANLTMFQNVFQQDNIDGTYWTLIVEMNFYILMLAIGKSKYLEVTGAVAVVILLLYGTLYSTNYKLNEVLTKYVGIVNFFPLFVMGIVYYRLKFVKKTWFRYALLVVCYFAQLSLFHILFGRTQLVNIRQYTFMVGLYNVVFLLYVFDKLGFIVNKVSLFMGKISYPLYLIHLYISLDIIMPFLLKHMPFWFAAVIDLVAVVIVAYLINIFVEKPSMVYFRGKLLKRREAAAAAA